ncbi:MAG: type II secretion system protein [Bacilli bacterium]|nr:type II secretion system protein [Bacilli bacterium]
MNKKKRKNQKGFTLIELLAVVVILLAISVMAISSISAAIERNKAKQDNAKKEVIVSYGRLYYDEHRNQYTRSCECIPVSLLDLDEKEGEDANGEKFDGYVQYFSGTFSYVESCNCPN